MEPTFRVGDLAVYPAHGVAQIVGIETREISGNKQTFYILKILENGMKIMIPTRNAGAVGLRELIRAGWPRGAMVRDNTLDAYVARLRRKLGELDGSPEIVTVHGVGYRVG